MSGEKLKAYQDKRDFDKTQEPEPRVKAQAGKDLIFVVQRHDASRLHYDFRLELDGVLMSWAVPKGPSLNPQDKRLAVRVEDHPYDYHDFEGTIPKGEYGGGVVQVWDQGTWEPLGDAAKMMAKGDFKFTLKGERLQGNWVLVRLKPKEGEEDKSWLLIKEKDDFVQADFKIDDFPESVLSGKSLEEIGPEFYTTGQGKAKTKSKEKPDQVKTKPAKAKKSQGLPFEDCQVMLAQLKDKPPQGKDWVYELKYDGFRILIYKDGGKVRLVTRNGQDYTEKLAKLAEAVSLWAEDDFVLDGEAVVFQGDRTDFQALQNHLKTERGRVSYMAFDLLALGGKDLRSEPLDKRKAALKDLLAKAPDDLSYSSHTQGDGQDIFETICQTGQEGIIAKKLTSAYTSGRHGDWVKLKCDNRQEFIIAGYTQSDKKDRGISSLLLARSEGRDIVYAGRAGTGFSQEESLDLEKRLNKMQVKESTVLNLPGPRSNEEIFLVEPSLLAEIKYAEITRDGLLRQASFKGLRQDKDPAEVVLETSQPGALKTPIEKQVKPAEPKAKAKPAGSDRGIPLTSPDKIMYSEISKQAVDDYYALVGDRLLEYGKDRLVTLVRCPEGERGDCFYQKHLKETMPGLKERTISENDGDKAEYFYLESKEGLHSAVQYGTIEFHGWGSRIDKLEKPDLMVFDLDPDEGMDLKQVRQGVKDLKAILDDLALVSFLKTSGGKGYHVMVPLKPQGDWETVRDFAKNVALAMEKKWPKKYTANMTKAKRKGRIYIDWVRNGRSATSVLAYSLRARDKLPVSAPIAWEELDEIGPQDITLVNIEDRLDQDPWQGLAQVDQSLK